jgi:hypothetical protein
MRKLVSVFFFLGSFAFFSMLCPVRAVAQVNVSPAALNFGTVTVNQSSSSATFTVTNADYRDLYISQLSSGLSEFVVSGPSLPLFFPRNATVSFQVIFRPVAATTYGGNIQITSNAQNGPLHYHTVAVSGTGKAAPPPSTTPTYLLSPSASSLTFPSTVVGSAYSQPLSITNTGTGNVTISQVNYTGAGFSVSGFSGSTTLAPSKALSLSTTFAPTVVGSAMGTLTVVSNATVSPALVLTGTGVQPQIAVAPSSASFGSAVVGSNNTQTFKISNPGTATLNLSQALLTGTGFSLSGLTAPLSVPAGGAASFTVNFKPGSAANFSGSLTLLNNSPNSSVVLAFSGTGIASAPQISVSPASVNFGTMSAGTSTTQTVTLTNAGNASLSLSQDNLVGSGFTLSGLALPVTLSSGQSTSFSVGFAPTTTGSYSATVNVISNAVNSPTAVSLTGSGAASGSHSVTLSWTPSASAYVGFDVFRGTVSGGPYTQINTAMVPTPTYTDTTVAAGQTYYYVATQLNSSGVQSGYSNETVAVIP